MQTMAKLRRHVQVCALAVLGVALSLTESCTRSEPLNTDAVASASNEQQLPFRPDTEQTSTDGDHLPIPSDQKLPSGLPFRSTSRPRILPAGTLLTVALEGSLSTPRVHAGDLFTASVAAPLTIDGATLIPRGAAVTGRVESAQSQPGRPGLVPGSGYFRLTLSAITVDGHPVGLQTSSLFTRGTVEPPRGLAKSSPSHQRTSIRLQKGRPLTFRLTAPVMLGDSNSTASGQFPVARPDNPVALR
jgi:hypothetical protein